MERRPIKFSVLLFGLSLIVAVAQTNSSIQVTLPSIVGASALMAAKDEKLHASTISVESYLSPSSITVLEPGKTLLIGHFTGKRLDLFDIPSRKVTRSISLLDKPNGFVRSMDNKQIYVVSGDGSGMLSAMELSSGKPLWQIPIGHSPMSPILSRDGKSLYVCYRFDNAVGIIDLVSRRQTQLIPVAREPLSSCLTADGLLFVANGGIDGPANTDDVACKISVIDVSQGKLVTHIKLPNGSTGLHQLALSPDGQHVYIPHLLARYQVPTTQIERGWINTNAFSIIGVNDLKVKNTFLLDEVDRGFANPWAVTLSPNNQLVYITSAGNNEVGIINLPNLNSKVVLTQTAQNDDSKNAGQVGFATGLMRKIKLKGVGPRSIVLQGDELFVAEYFSDSLSVVLFEDGKEARVESIPLGPSLPLTHERKGEIAFNDARLCFQNWQSCSSCHGPEARTDGFNWDLMNDGIGNPKNVRSLFLSHQRSPLGWLGIRETADNAVRAGFIHILFTTPPEAEVQAIEAYIESLQQVPSPRLIKGQFSESAQRGKKIFSKSGCIDCHTPPIYTNLKKVPNGLGMGPDEGKSFVVAPLREVWRTAPYLHDGRAPTLHEAIISHCSKARNLTTAELSDLIEFVGSL